MHKNSRSVDHVSPRTKTWRHPHDRQNPLSNKRVFSIMIIALSDPPANAGLGGTSRGTACIFAKSSRFENGISKSHHDSQIERVGTRLIIAGCVPHLPASS